MRKKKEKRVGVRSGAGTLRRSMDVTAALLRCALACSAFIVAAGALSVSGLYQNMPDWAASLIQAALTLLCFGLPAVYGLFYADGNQWEKLPVRALSAEQLRALAAAGVLLSCPATLLVDLVAAPFARMELIAKETASAPPFALFLPMFLRSVLIVPLCEELFFRGYLSAVLREAGVRGAALISALFFALVHGVDAAFASRFLSGLLLYALMMRTQSLLAPVIVHAAYNLTILLLSFSGLGVLFSGIGFVSCLLRVSLCAVFVYVLKRAYGAKGTEQTLRFGYAPTPRQWLLIVFALAALMICPPLFAA